MTNRIADISQRQAAIVVGVAVIIMFIFAVIPYFLIRPSLIVPGDAATTANNIMASEGLFRISIASELIMFLSELVLALALYVLLKPVNKSLALLAAWFRVVHVAILGSNLLNLYVVLQLLSGADYLTVFEPDQLHALVLLFLNAYSYGFNIQVFSGLHLFVSGYLVFKSGYFPRILGILLVVAGLNYIIDTFAFVLLPNYVYPVVFLALPVVIAENAFFMWLLWKGVRNEIPEMKS